MPKKKLFLLWYSDIYLNIYSLLKLSTIGFLLSLFWSCWAQIESNPSDPRVNKNRSSEDNVHEIQLDSEETNVRNLLKFKQFQNLKQTLKSDSVVNHTIFGDDHTIFYLEVYVLIEAYFEKITCIVPSICAVRMALQFIPSCAFVHVLCKIAVSVLIALTSWPLIVHNLSWDCLFSSLSEQIVTISPVRDDDDTFVTALGCP